MKKICRIKFVRKYLIGAIVLCFIFFSFSVCVSAENATHGIGEEEWENFSLAIPPEAEEYFPQNS